MWTCGIAIATQQAMLATHNSAVSVLVESARSIRGGGALAWSRTLAPPIWARSASKSSAIASALKMPSAMWVARQPTD